MDNEQRFDLTSPHSAEFDTAQECFYTAIIMQNRTAVQWQPKNLKERKT